MLRAGKPVLVAAVGVALFAAVLGGAAAFALGGDAAEPTVGRTWAGHEQMVSFHQESEPGHHGSDRGFDCPGKGTRGTEGTTDPAQY